MALGKEFNLELDEKGFVAWLAGWLVRSRSSSQRHLGGLLGGFVVFPQETRSTTPDHNPLDLDPGSLRIGTRILDSNYETSASAYGENRRRFMVYQRDCFYRGG